MDKIKAEKVYFGPLQCDKEKICSSYLRKCGTCKNNKALALQEKSDYYIPKEEEKITGDKLSEGETGKD